MYLSTMAIRSITDLFKDLFRSMFGLKSRMVFFVALFFATTYYFVDFFTLWIWSPYWSFVLLQATLLADMISAIGVSYKRGGGFETRKSFKTILTGLSYTVMLGLIFNLPRVNDEFGFSELTPTISHFGKAVYTFCYTNLALSFLKNVTIIGLIPGPIGKMIYRYIDVYKNDVGDQINNKLSLGKRQSNEPEQDDTQKTV